jgi:hypothetical protein
MTRLRYFLVLLLLLALAAPLPGWAVREAGAASQETSPVQAGVPLDGRGEGFQPEPFGAECPATFGPIITDTAVTIEKGMFAVQPTFGLSFVTHRFNKDWERLSAGGDFVSFAMEWKLTYGLLNNLEVFVVIPYVHNWASNVEAPGFSGERAADSGDLGDINLTFKYLLLPETRTRPTVTFLLATDFPSGRFRALNPSRLGTEVTSGGAYVFTTGLNLSKYLRPFMLYGNVWYSMPTAFTDDDGRQYPRDFVTVNLAAELPLTKKWVALLELTSFWDGGRLFGRKANVPPGAVLSILPGIEYMATEKFSLALGVNVDLAGKNADATVTPLLSMVYAF